MKRPLAFMVIVMVLLSSAGTAFAAKSQRAAIVAPVTIKNMKVMNYEPTDASWTNFWLKASYNEVDADYTAIAQSGANVVRIIIPATPGDFGYPTPNPDMVTKLAIFVQLAASHNLKVQLTLFDWFNDPSDTAGSVSWLRMVVAPYANDPRIAFIELRNEIPPWNDAWTSWFLATWPVLKATVGNIPCTVSVTDDAFSSINTDPVGYFYSILHANGMPPMDLLDLHFYGKAADAKSVFAGVKSISATTPVFVGETGMSSAPIGKETKTKAEARQASFFKTVYASAKTVGIDKPSPWVWQDLQWTGLPLGLTKQKTSLGLLQWGLLRTDGSYKPAYNVVKAAFSS